MSILNNIISQVNAADIVGTITVPSGVPSQVAGTGNFISGLIRMVMVAGGIFSLWQFLSGGFQMISSGGDKGKISEAQQKIQMSITGLITMTASFILIAIISQILFGNPLTILVPNITPIK